MIKPNSGELIRQSRQQATIGPKDDCPAESFSTQAPHLGQVDVLPMIEAPELPVILKLDLSHDMSAGGAGDRVVGADRPLLSVVIACQNDEPALGLCINKAMLVFDHMGVLGEVLVVTDGAAEGLLTVAEQYGARVIQTVGHRQDAALIAGCDAARGHFIVLGQADGAYDFLAIEPFIWALRSGADLVIGNRFAGGVERGAMPWLYRWIVSPVFSALARQTLRVRDFQCGLRAFRRDAWQDIRPGITGVVFAAEMLVAATRCGLRIAEVPMHLYCSRSDPPSSWRWFMEGWHHLRYVLGAAPDALFMALGASLMMTGAWLQAVLAVSPLELPPFRLGTLSLAFGGFITLIGLNLFGLGAIGRVVFAHSESTVHRSEPLRLAKVFKLERGLLLGAAFSVLGCVQAIVHLSEWGVESGHSGKHLAHPVMVAMQTLALGMNLACLSIFQHLLTRGSLMKRRASSSD